MEEIRLTSLYGKYPIIYNTVYTSQVVVYTLMINGNLQEVHIN